MSVKLLTEHNLEFLSLKCGLIGSSKSTLVKMPHCWKSHAGLINIMLLFSGSSAICCGRVQYNNRGER